MSRYSNNAISYSSRYPKNVTAYSGRYNKETANSDLNSFSPSSPIPGATYTLSVDVYNVVVPPVFGNSYTPTDNEYSASFQKQNSPYIRRVPPINDQNVE